MANFKPIYNGKYWNVTEYYLNDKNMGSITVNDANNIIEDWERREYIINTTNMPKSLYGYTPEYRKKKINDTINLIGHNGEQIDIFKLHGILYIGNTKDSVWDIEKGYAKLSEHSLPISLEEFEDYETKEEIENRFAELLEEVVTDKLL